MKLLHEVNEAIRVSKNLENSLILNTYSLIVERLLSMPNSEIIQRFLTKDESEYSLLRLTTSIINEDLLISLISSPDVNNNLVFMSVNRVISSFLTQMSKVEANFNAQTDIRDVVKILYEQLQNALVSSQLYTQNVNVNSTGIQQYFEPFYSTGFMNDFFKVVTLETDEGLCYGLKIMMSTGNHAQPEKYILHVTLMDNIMTIYQKLRKVASVTLNNTENPLKPISRLEGHLKNITVYFPLTDLAFDFNSKF